MRRALRLALRGLAVILVLLIGSCVFLGTRPDLLLNPIDRHIYLAAKTFGVWWRSDPISLAPGEFASGEPRASWERRVSDAGYVLLSTRPGPVVPKPGALTTELDQIRTYSKVGPSWWVLFCTESYDVSVGVEPDGTLLSADGSVERVCI